MDLGVAAREGTTGVASDVRERKKKSSRSVNSFVLCVCVEGRCCGEGRKGGNEEGRTPGNRNLQTEAVPPCN